ncbi:MAG: hypothetical protein LBQ45_00255 [Mycoplasmataceae bacterium]|nr:hypothetical protein [Mycoplasmataceae bacterium]
MINTTQLSTDDDNPFPTAPTKLEVLLRLKQKNPGIDLNQIDVNVSQSEWDPTHVLNTGSDYSGSYKVSIPLLLVQLFILAMFLFFILYKEWI